MRRRMSLKARGATPWNMGGGTQFAFPIKKSSVEIPLGMTDSKDIIRVTS
jgi:hypothetical protein